MANLTIIANITAKADKLGKVQAELVKLIEPTRAEKGCVSYMLHQDNKNPEHFLFVERWENYELWQEHIQSTHLQGFIAATKDDLADFSVCEMTAIS